MALHVINWEHILGSDLDAQWQLIDSGKTKLIYPNGEAALRILHRDVITANDNPIYTGHAEGKGVASAYSTALIFKRIAEHGVPTAHMDMWGANATIDKKLSMLPFEVIWRRYNVAGNSWMKRNPGNKYAEWQRYDEIIYEACLKWSVRLADNSVVHDPFLVLDENFRPQLRPDGMPRLMHSKNSSELEYVGVIHPNKWGDISDDQVRSAIEWFTQHSSTMRGMMGIIQQTTFDTYAEIGRLNADGKVEFGLDSNGQLTLGDELELDSLRNISLISGHTDDIEKPFYFSTDILGKDLSAILMRSAASVNQIVASHHSGKQVYRELMKQVDENMAAIDRIQGESVPDEHKIAVRRQMNDAMAQHVTNTVYIPTALALSNQFGKQVGYVLAL